MSCHKMSMIPIRSWPLQSTCLPNRRDPLPRHGTSSADCKSRAATTEPGCFKGKGRGKGLNNKNGKSKGKDKTKDKRSCPRERKGEDSWNKDSSWRPWSSENRKGPLTRDKGGKGQGTPLRKKRQRSDGHRWDDLATIGFVKVQTGHWHENNLQRNAFCAETSIG